MHYVDFIGLTAFVGLMVTIRLVYEAGSVLCFALSHSYHEVLVVICLFILLPL